MIFIGFIAGILFTMGISIFLFGELVRGNELILGLLDAFCEHRVRLKNKTQSRLILIKERENGSLFSNIPHESVRKCIEEICETEARNKENI